MTGSPAATRSAASALRLLDGIDPQHCTSPGQSLADGAAGIALAHIEAALAGHRPWDAAHRWVRLAAADPVRADAGIALMYGAPALAFVLHAARADGLDRYASARTQMDDLVDALTRHRLQLAHDRLDQGRPGTFGEYDLLSGLTGIGAHLLHHRPGSEHLPGVLAYLVRLVTEEILLDGERLPGWWVAHDPCREPMPGPRAGHANLGIAHGITGPLALLAAAARRGVTVPGHREAITAILRRLDTWKQPGRTGSWWPYYLTFDELLTGHSHQRRPARPSWCYGTPGIARAQQAAAIATGDTRRQMDAEHTLAACLADPAQTRMITDAGLCHGWAGIVQTTGRAARDAAIPQLAGLLTARLSGALTCLHRIGAAGGPGLLEGAAGTALTLLSTRGGEEEQPIRSGWDALMLIN
ncbi:lanthionine synthetase C family protein [Rhizohabitans arisaemae]|uniref:lanthionine synthetase C family protein n=1 Tax=Rhizohabitans arisaemae TaxID=2720610 RepID=UPI0024B18070|nr:lanthionine synthetase C family protein [Rhizohabitans arisaemae]